MELVLNNPKTEYFEIISLQDLGNINTIFKRFTSLKGPLKATIYSINESISVQQLSKFKINLQKFNPCSLCIYSNNRETIIAAKSLKINSNFVKENELKNKLLLHNSKNNEDTLYEGTVRSGARILI